MAPALSKQSSDNTTPPLLETDSTAATSTNTTVNATITNSYYCCFCCYISADTYSVSSSEDEARKETVNLDTWLKRKDVLASFKCQEVQSNGYLASSHILLTELHMFVLREIPKRAGWAHIQHRHHLGSIVKITSKRKHPELITFKYGTADEDNIDVKSAERYVIPNAQKATKKIKDRILKVIGE